MKTAKEVLIEHFAKHEGISIEEATKSLGGDFEELDLLIAAMKEYAAQALKEVEIRAINHGMWSYCDQMIIYNIINELK